MKINELFRGDIERPIETVIHVDLSDEEIVAELFDLRQVGPARRFPPGFGRVVERQRVHGLEVAEDVGFLLRRRVGQIDPDERAVGQLGSRSGQYLPAPFHRLGPTGGPYEGTNHSCE